MLLSILIPANVSACSPSSEPIMSRKEECSAVTNELAPGQDVKTVAGFQKPVQVQEVSSLVAISDATLTIGGPLISGYCEYHSERYCDLVL
ncbi:hypothetical protein RB195_011307 [Necator americanus]|uniref:Uncharacterized protein n=1 Tax=Necator americanus TaxID=51031 RepID=A0ABR1D2M7_NECAM